jgi:predicted dehydrogenase
MKALIIGFGSIGKRHARILAGLGVKVAVASQQDVKEYPRFINVSEALSKHAPDYVVVANVTSQHGRALSELKDANYRGKVLCEKPLYLHAAEDESPYPFSLHVAYQLRFHPLISALKERLKTHQAFAAQLYVGQHLSIWRPGRDHKNTYSASKAEGGGVLRDLSHELDLARYLFGEVMFYQAMITRAGNVTNDSDDVAAFILNCKHCRLVSVQMNCLDYVPRREILVTTDTISYKLDLLAHKFWVNDEAVDITCESDDAYRAMHQAVMGNAPHPACTLAEGLALCELIDTVEAEHTV